MVTCTTRRFSIVLAILGLTLVSEAILMAQRDSARTEGVHLGQARSIEIPLDADAGWQRLSYRGIAPNNIEFAAAGLRIQVDQSAGPLVYPLASPLTVTHLTVRGRLDGDLRLGSGRQGEKGFDDYIFRAGLVLKGDRRLGGLQRLFAPDWIRRLHALAPPGDGISMVRFFNVGSDKHRIGDRRVHPLSDLLSEEIVAVPDADGTFVVRAVLSPPVETLALWLSSDGDDTASVFSVLIDRITLVEDGTAEAPRSP